MPEPPAEKRHEFLPPTVPTYSRWRKSETSFGLVGRIGWTVGVVAVMALTIISLNPFAMIAWLIIGGPLILRSVWARKRIT